ncbi:MAG: peptidoglycan-associated lipoprotein Pal [Candidatus Omnitrophica bacterium]|nr:peptidoglycan-associated lipoprotein Pal [Candidatus Omnitrophota bacterium]
MKLEKVICAVLSAVILSWMLSGCCPYSKKKTAEKEIQPAVEAVSPQKTAIVQREEPSVPLPVKPDIEKGKATPAEVNIAVTGGEIPVAKPEGEVKFVEPEEKLKEIFQPIYFDFDRYNIKTSEQKKLKILAEYLRNNPEISILIEGHCDERGSDEYNLVLGEKRALSARSFLIGLGIAPARLYTISYGESKPVDPGHNEEAWAKNRRAEFKIKQ